MKKLRYLDENHTNYDENDIFEGLEKQLKIVKIYSEIIEIREEMKTKQIEENLTLPVMGGPNAHVT